ncbi:unnamed protein product [Rotaria socialis]
MLMTLTFRLIVNQGPVKRKRTLCTKILTCFLFEGRALETMLGKCCVHFIHTINDLKNCIECYDINVTEVEVDATSFFTS